MTTQPMTLEEVHSLAFSAFMEAGANAEHASAVADTITAAERDGCASHGLFRLPGYLKALQSGKAKGAPNVTVEKIAPSVLRVDADNAFAPLAVRAGHPPLIELARETGVAALALVKTHHFSALWPDTEPLAKAGLAALACTAYMPVMAPAGAQVPFFGTNPLSFAWPRKDGEPMVFDMATAAMARGELQIAARDGHSVPETAGIGPDGQPSTDPAAILKGAQLPFGGYKGSAIALMVEMLCAGLIGEAFSDEAKARDNGDGGPPQGGEFILALDPERFGNAAGWQDHADAYLARFEALPGGPLLPGSRRRHKRATIAENGVSVPTSLIDDIHKQRGKS